MFSLLAAILLVMTIVALLAKQALVALILAPFAWLAMRKAANTRDDLESLMGVCLMACAAGVLIEFAGALFP